MDTSRKPVSLAYVRSELPSLYAQLNAFGDLEDSYDRTDLQLYTHNDEVYVESHDERTLFVWRNDQLVELNFDDRPQ